MFNILLIVAGILEYILLGIKFKGNFQNTYLGGILIAVAFLNAFIDWYQVQKSEKILASFLAMIPPSCRVLRDSTILTIPAAELVKGDIVLLVRSSIDPHAALLNICQRTGDKTPADLVIIAATDLKVDNSSLTGESEPQERRPLPDGTKARPVEAENLVCSLCCCSTSSSYTFPGFQLYPRHQWRRMGCSRTDRGSYPYRSGRKAYLW